MALCGVKFKAHPTQEQKRVLSQWMGAGRFIYNAKVAEHEYFRTFKAHSLALVGVPVPVDQCYSQFKTEMTAWLKDIPSQVLRNAAYRWREAYQRYVAGLAERPVRKRKGNRDSVWLTSELFELKPKTDDQTGDVSGYKLMIGTKTNQIGALSFDARREFESPHSITVSRRNGEYFVSFNYEDGQELATEEELQVEYSQMDEANLEPITVGLDRGVVIPVYPSEGEPFELTPEQKHTIDHCDRQINRQQKRLSRQVKGSRRRERTKRKLARYHARKADVRRDFAHQTSYRLATSDHRIFVVEDLKIKNMTASPSPQPKADGNGYEPNGAAAKAGLNRSILAAAWGMVVTFLKYKALQRRKLVISVAAYRSSQECASCGHIHPANRVSQSQFHCQRCGHVANADHNGAQVVKKRGIAALKTKSAGASPPSSPAGTRGSARRGSIRRRKEGQSAQPATLTDGSQAEARTAQDQPV